jgi:Tfp pilus assembly protein PilN
MATTITPEVPAPRAEPNRPTPPDGVRFVAVRANLLPDEIVSARQVEVVRRQVVVGVLTVVALLVGWFALSWWQTTLAHNDLDTARHRTVALRGQQNEFAPLVQAQSQAAAIHDQLAQLMATDLPWQAMLSRLRHAAPPGVSLAGITGSMTGGPGTAAGSGGVAPGAVLNQSGKQAVGQLTLTGSAGSKDAVAAYADSLAEAPGLTSPLITSVTGQGGRVAFTLTAIITSDALGGRFTPAASAPTGGK